MLTTLLFSPATRRFVVVPIGGAPDPPRSDATYETRTGANDQARFVGGHPAQRRFAKDASNPGMRTSPPALEKAASPISSGHPRSTAAPVKYCSATIPVFTWVERAIPGQQVRRLDSRRIQANFPSRCCIGSKARATSQIGLTGLDQQALCGNTPHPRIPPPSRFTLAADYRNVR